MTDNKQEALNLLVKANELYKKRMFTEALALFEKAKEVNPTLFEAQFSIAKTHIRLDKPQESVILFKQALELVPEDKKAYYTLGFAGILYKNNDFSEAYQTTKSLFKQKIQAQKLSELLKFPVAANAYDDVINILSQYTDEEQTEILSKLTADSSISTEAKDGLQNHITNLKNTQNWDAFDDDLDLEKEEITEKVYKAPEKTVKKKGKGLKWLWLLFVLALLGGIAFFGKDYALEYMAWEDAKKTDKIGTYKRFLRNYPNSKNADIATEFIEIKARDEAIDYGTTEAIKEFMSEYPKSKLLIAVPININDKNGILKIRGYETLKEEYLYNAKASESNVKLLKGSKVEIQYITDSIINKPLILTIDQKTKISFGLAKDDSDKSLEKEEAITSDNNEDSDTKETTSEEVLNAQPFNFVQIPPSHPDCKQKTQSKKNRCFEQKIRAHIKANLDIPAFKKLSLSKTKHKVPFFFVIDKKGNVTGIKVRASHTDIEQNIINSIKTLPTFIAGVQDDTATAVSYNSEISFSTATTIVPPIPLDTGTPGDEEPVEVSIPTNLSIQEADRAPIYPGCEGNTGISLVKCTSGKINNYISSTINHDNLKGHNLTPGKQHAVINFKLTPQGSVSNISVNTENNIIKKEIIRVVKSLPYMSPALYEDTPAGINYRLTLDVDIKLEK